MKKISILIITLTMILVCTTAAWGVSFGARAAGMGGAFTAVADDCSAVYWNPAGITQLKVLTITPGVGFQGRQEQIDAITKMTGDSGLDAMMRLLDSLGNDGLYVDLTTYVGVTTKFVGVNAFLDSNFTIIQESILNKSYAEANGYGIGTIAIPFGPLAVGGNVKLVYGAYGKNVMPILNTYDLEAIMADPASYDALTNENSNYSISATGTGVAFDVGVLFSLTDLVKLGFTGRNIYSSVAWEGSLTKKKFNFTTGEFAVFSENSFTENKPLPSTYSFGAALRPTSSTLIAADAEIITNPIDADFNQTLFHVGLEQTALWKTVALRLGAFTAPGDEMGYSAGLGFKLGPILVDGAVTLVAKDMGFYATAGFKF